MNRRDVNAVVRKLRISSNCVVMIKIDPDDPDKTQALADNFVDAMNRVGAKDSFVIVVDDLDDIHMLNRDEMNRGGWFRRNQLASLFMKMTKEADKRELEKEEFNGNSGSV